MLAWTVTELGDPSDVLRLREVADPSPRARQVLIRVEAAALNFPDALLCRGQYQHKPDLPFLLGGELAGRVVATGPDSELSVGDRVAALVPGGGFAELVVSSDRTAFPLDDLPLSWSEAAALPASFQTAFAALHLRAGVRDGENVLVHAGAGGFGSAAIQLAVQAGARVIATAGGPDKAETCRRLGAHVALDYRETTDLPGAIRDATDGAGVDVVVDPVGGAVSEASLKCLAFGGRLVLVGFASGSIPVLAANRILLKNVSVLGLHWGLYAKERPAIARDVHRQIVDLVAAGRVRPVVSGDFEWGERPALLQKLADGRTWGKVVVRPAGGQP